MSETDVPPPDYEPQTFAVWFNEQIAGLPARPSERQLLKVINGAVTYIDDLRYELPTEQTVLDVTNVVTNIKSPLDRLSARHLTQQVLNGIGDIADGAKFVLLRPREPQQEAARALQQETLTQVMEIEKRVGSLLARLTQQEMVNSIKNIESLFNSREEEKKTEPWSIVASGTNSFDRQKAEKWNADLDNLLLYASLFSAVVATFAVEGVKTEVGDPIENRKGRASNSLIFASLMISLATASAGTLVKQWIQQYLEEDSSSIPRHHVCMRQYRYDGLRKWKVPLIVGLLPVILRISFIIFSVGLTIRLYNFDRTAAISFAALGGTWVLLSLLATLSHLFSDNCPYRSPESLLVRNIRSFVIRNIQPLFPRFFTQLIRFCRHFLYRLPHNILIRHLQLSLNLFLYFLFHFPFPIFLYNFIDHYLYGHRLKPASWDSWQEKDYSIIILPRPDGIVTLRKEVRATKRALSGLKTWKAGGALAMETKARDLFDEALSALSDVENASDTDSIRPSISPKLHAARRSLITLMPELEPNGAEGQTERSYDGRQHFVVKQANRAIHAIDRARSIVQVPDSVTELGIQALVTSFLELAPSNPSIADAITKCAQRLPVTAAVQVIQRVGIRCMPRSAPYKNTEPQHWGQVWSHWDESDEMVRRIRGLTRSGSKALLVIASNAVSEAYIVEAPNEARKDKSDTCFIGDIAEPAICCMATLLIRPGPLDTELRKRVAQAVLKLLADYEEQEPHWASPDGWSETPLVAFRAAIRLCQDAPSDADDFFEKPKNFEYSRHKIEKLLQNASYDPDVQGPNRNAQEALKSHPIWCSVFQTDPPLDASVTAYVLLRLASLSSVESTVVDTFFDKWSDRYYAHTLEQQQGPWADKLLSFIEGAGFGDLDNAVYFKRMFGWRK